MKLTRKQKIDQQRGYAAERAIGPIRDAIARGDLVITPALVPVYPTAIHYDHPCCVECGQTEPAHKRDDIGTCERFRGVHGETCPKALHTNPDGGYLHAADDDRPYDVDGMKYCGRCHYAI